MTHGNIQRFGAISLVIGLVAMALTGCAQPQGVTAEDGFCALARPIYLSEASIAALRDAPREDRVAIAAHNRTYEESCEGEGSR